MCVHVCGGGMCGDVVYVFMCDGGMCGCTCVVVCVLGYVGVIVRVYVSVGTGQEK